MNSQQQTNKVTENDPPQRNFLRILRTIPCTIPRNFQQFHRNIFPDKFCEANFLIKIYVRKFSCFSFHKQNLRKEQKYLG